MPASGKRSAPSRENREVASFEGRGVPSTEGRGVPALVERFKATFDGALPSHLSRAPGRVNLIGEHTDYNGLPVLPMALRREITLLFSPRDDGRVRVANVDSEFGPREFTLAYEISPSPAGDWGNYLKAPCQALTRRHGGTASAPALRGFDALVSSTLPVASGLSSSSALVIAVGGALVHANGLEIPTLAFAQEMAEAERYTGTRGGGMDQAISAGALQGHASRIEFEPLELVPTPIPEDWRFLVAHSLVRAEKSGRAQEAYNLRTRECRQALEILAEHGTFRSYRQLLDEMCIQDLVELGEAHLDGPLLKRFRHVVTEGNRVYDAEHALRRSDRLTFGLLMNASHESLRDDYEVSSTELDTLVELALAGGAAGARLTGAGFGGCIVALATRERTPAVLARLREGYFLAKELPGSLEEVLFVAEAGPGASVRAL